MVLSASARSTKSQLKKKGYTEKQAIDYLIEHKFITIKDIKTEDPDLNQANDSHKSSNIPPPMLPSAGIGGTEITEEYAEQYLLLCAVNNPGDPKVAALLIQWLDKKKALNPKLDLEESNSAVTEFTQIRKDFYGNHPACSDSPTD
jgi:hypothetical protein